MKNYELFEFEGRTYAIYVVDNTKTTFDIESDSTSAVEYRRYTAWVEAGNTPEDFWSQSDDFLYTSVSEVTEPKEEKEKPQETEGES